MDRRVVAALSLVLGLFALLFFLRDDSPAPPPPPAVVAVPPPPLSPKTPPTPTRSVRAPAIDTAAADAPHPGQDAVVALAAALEQGTIRCAVPTELGADLALPFAHKLVVPGLVVATVDEPAGEVIVRLAGPDGDLLMEDADAWRAALKESIVPRGTLVWAGAEPGETGTCAFHEARWVRVRGRAEGPLITERGMRRGINGCGTGGTQDIAEDGTFDFQVPAQARCTLEVGSSGFGQFGTVIQPTEDVDGVVVNVMPSRVGGDTAMVTEMKEKALQMEVALEEYDAGEDPYSAALAEEGLSQESADFLRAWRSNGRADAENKLEHYRKSAKFFAKDDPGP